MAEATKDLIKDRPEMQFKTYYPHDYCPDEPAGKRVVVSPLDKAFLTIYPDLCLSVLLDMLSDSDYKKRHSIGAVWDSELSSGEIDLRAKFKIMKVSNYAAVVIPVNYQESPFVLHSLPYITIKQIIAVLNILVKEEAVK